MLKYIIYRCAECRWRISLSLGYSNLMLPNEHEWSKMCASIADFFAQPVTQAHACGCSVCFCGFLE